MGFLSEQVLSGCIHVQREVRCCCVSEVPCYLPVFLFTNMIFILTFEVSQYIKADRDTEIWEWLEILSDDRKREHTLLFPSR